MKLNWRHFINFGFIFELFLYSFCLFLAIGTALNILSMTAISQAIFLHTNFTVWQFIITFIVATIALLLILKYFKRPWVLQILFYLAVIEGLLIFSQAYFTWPYDLIVIIVILAYWLIFRNILMHDIMLVLAISGLSVILGFDLEPRSAIIILILIAIYDFWAVYKTKHMVKMFREMAEKKVHFALIIPPGYKGLFNKVKDVIPQSQFMFVGTGDIAIPAIFVITCLKINLLTSLITALGAILGFIFLYILFVTQEERAPMPGLPPIVLGTLLGFLISFLF
ncbi:MAG: presenilin family intramembrane aspartyl protease [Candidatus Parcubacteria bacterium]|nr:presenilin family intramembrane aspartyl protease [Candidatus Parcubacteria bacterium]